MNLENSNEHIEKKKKFGQNFLTGSGGRAITEKISNSFDCKDDTGILEIGPGQGALTEKLLQISKKVVSVEIDDDLIPFLEKKFGENPNFKLIHNDILKVDIKDLIETEFSGMKVCVCANLPYYITTPIISALIQGRFGFEHITVMVQKEAAARLCADKNNQLRTANTVILNYFAKVEKLFNVPAGCFSPVPKVDSAVIRITPYKTPPVNVGDENLFFEIIKAAFSQRRKTLSNSLSGVLCRRMQKSEIPAFFESLGFKPNSRGECFDIFDFAKISLGLFEK